MMKKKTIGALAFARSVQAMAVYIILVLLLSPSSVLFSEERSNAKPNIVLFLADDLRVDTLGMLGHPIVKTPNIDELAKEGLVFRNTYVLGSHVQAVCVASRTMIQTGQSYFKRRPTTPTLAQTIESAGYASIRSGKHQGNPNHFDRDFDESPDGGNADGNADNLIRFIGEHAGKEPLFLYMAPHEPHDPQYAPDDYYSMYDAKDISLPENFQPYHPFDNGEMEVRDELNRPWPRTREIVTSKLARYYASTTFWDAQCGRVIEAMKDAGQFENTIFIVAADNGLALGEHGLLGKQNLYERCGMHVPLIFIGPEIPKGEMDAFAYLFDIYPTMCELAGIPVPDGLDATSLTPIIKGKSDSIHDSIFTSYRDVQRSIRDKRWKLIRYPKVDVTQLFDLENDPFEKNNLSRNPEYASKVNELMAMLKETQPKYGDKLPLTAEEVLSAEWTPEIGRIRAAEIKALKKSKSKKHKAIGEIR